MSNQITRVIRPSIHQLQPGDLLMIYSNDHNIYIIIQGVIIINKLFSNNERFSSDLVCTGHIIQDIFQQGKYYNYCYELTPIVNTYIISIPSTSKNLYKSIITAYHTRTKQQSSEVNLLSIWIHKSIRNRIIHLLLLLCEVTGRSYQHSLVLDVQLSYKLIATITGSTRNTASRIIRQLENDYIIEYTKKQIRISNIFLLNKYAIL
uniref:Global nitrogen transcriptional regulator n=1 Tax=Neoizziella asiatica TaxID=1077397 RepID=A0A1G4NXB8_9FLOR|nr:Global nitrogen transcriptional regulator [Neoizziella asiatica]SCW23274.1 Global nitrogen transcriptional regulator [Neoizziella asiatica]